MEQRIGPSSKPLEGAGFDPAFIPGLTTPAKPDEPDTPEAPEDEVPTARKPPEDETAAPEPPKPEAETETETETDDEEEPESSEDPEPSVESDSSEGPVFEASDRRARIVADRAGVRLSLDEEACEFRWDEIGAVETEPARFGKRFTITVHTPDRRWYPIEIEAAARSRFKDWETQLDEVLDAYFQE
ncbi:hypothetical protein [Streptomyces sp. YIM S03343]